MNKDIVFRVYVRNIDSFKGLSDNFSFTIADLNKIEVAILVIRPDIVFTDYSITIEAIDYYAD